MNVKFRQMPGLHPRNMYSFGFFLLSFISMMDYASAFSNKEQLLWF